MNKTNLIILGIVGGLILLGAGYSYGIFTAQKGLEELQQAPTLLSELLASKVIKGLNTSAAGEIATISGRSLTLSAEGDTLTVLIRDDATLGRMVPPTEAATEVPKPLAREEIAFSDLKVGDRVAVACQLSAAGTFEGIDVTVLP